MEFMSSEKYSLAMFDTPTARRNILSCPKFFFPCADVHNEVGRRLGHEAFLSAADVVSDPESTLTVVALPFICLSLQKYLT